MLVSSLFQSLSDWKCYPNEKFTKSEHCGTLNPLGCRVNNLATSRHDELIEKYGRLLGPTEICRELKYPSVAALRAAKNRGRLPFRPIRLEGRPGIFAETAEVAALLDAVLARPAQPKEREESKTP